MRGIILNEQQALASADTFTVCKAAMTRCLSESDSSAKTSLSVSVDVFLTSSRPRGLALVLRGAAGLAAFDEVAFDLRKATTCEEGVPWDQKLRKATGISNTKLWNTTLSSLFSPLKHHLIYFVER